MVLESLEIIGFKSFSEKTLFKFSEGITAVVGPNGCGKSNILDAVKWVLGSRSIKSLRGEKMEDIIFSGSQHKDRSNHTQVSLTINNSNRYFNIDSEKIELTRRYYRDSQGDVYINKQKVPFRELEHLLMDTGLGKSCYSFMEQGKIDMILSSKPEERRFVFEEAAGISKFKQQQEEASKKLGSTQSNIIRIQDILKTIEKELKLKSEQAEKSLKFNQLKEEYISCDLKIKFISLNKLNDQNDAMSKKVSQKKAILEKNNQKKIMISETFEQDLQNKEIITKKLYEKKAQLNFYQQEKNQVIYMVEDKDKRIENSKTEKDRLGGQSRKFGRSVKLLKQKEGELKQQRLELNDQIEDKTALKKKLTQEVIFIEKNISQKEAEVIRLKKKQQAILLELKDHRAQHASIVQTLLKALDSERSNWLKNQEEKKKCQAKLESQIEIFFQEIEISLKSKNEVKPKLLNLLKTNSSQWKNMIQYLAEPDKALKDLFFSKESILAQKEDLDNKITSLEKELENNYLSISKTGEIIKDQSFLLDSKNKELGQLFNEIQIHEVQNQNIKEQKENYREQYRKEKEQLDYFQRLVLKEEKYISTLLGERQELLNNSSDLERREREDEKKVHDLEKKINKTENSHAETKKVIFDLDRKIQEITQEINELEIKNKTIQFQRDNLIQDIYNKYDISENKLYEQFENFKPHLNKEKEKLASIQAQIDQLGPVNPMASEEFDEIQKEYDHYQDQLTDIVGSKKNIVLLIEEILEASRSQFLTIFELVEKNFQTTFHKLFGGGDISLSLKDPAKPLESGIEINVQIPGTKKKMISLLSGGERTLTAIALMFAIYMVKSSPICILDEIDASLDDQNVVQLLEIINEFKDKTQFVLITHNKITMSKANTLLGVTMEEPGISKLVELSLKHTA